MNQNPYEINQEDIPTTLIEPCMFKYKSLYMNVTKNQISMLRARAMDPYWLVVYTKIKICGIINWDPLYVDLGNLPGPILSACDLWLCCNYELSLPEFLYKMFGEFVNESV